LLRLEVYIEAGATEVPLSVTAWKGVRHDYDDSVA